MALFYGKHKEKVYRNGLEILMHNYYSVYSMIPSPVREGFHHNLKTVYGQVKSKEIAPEEAIKRLNDSLNGHELRVSDLVWLAKHPELNSSRLSY